MFNAFMIKEKKMTLGPWNCLDVAPLKREEVIVFSSSFLRPHSQSRAVPLKSDSWTKLNEGTAYNNCCVRVANNKSLDSSRIKLWRRWSASAKTSRPDGLQAQGGTKDSGPFHVFAHPASAPAPSKSEPLWSYLPAPQQRGRKSETERHTDQRGETQRLDLAFHPPKEGRTTSQRPSANHSLCPIGRIRLCAFQNQLVAGWMGLSSNASGSPCELKLILQTEVFLRLMGGVEWTVGRPPLYPLL